MKTNRALGCAFAALVLAVAVAQAKPNFTGEWKMNPSKSDFGPMPAPDKLVQKIEQKDPDLKVSTTKVNQQGEFNTEMKYTTDGKECVNQIRGNELKSTLTWDGDALKVNSKLNFQGADVAISDKWTLSEDGKTLNVQRHFASSMGEMDQKMVLEKQ